MCCCNNLLKGSSCNRPVAETYQIGPGKVHSDSGSFIYHETRCPSFFCQHQLVSMRFSGRFTWYVGGQSAWMHLNQEGGFTCNNICNNNIHWISLLSDIHWISLLSPIQWVLIIFPVFSARPRGHYSCPLYFEAIDCAILPPSYILPTHRFTPVALLQSVPNYVLTKYSVPVNLL